MLYVRIAGSLPFSRSAPIRSRSGPLLAVLVFAFDALRQPSIFSFFEGLRRIAARLTGVNASGFSGENGGNPPPPIINGQCPKTGAPGGFLGL